RSSISAASRTSLSILSMGDRVAVLKPVFNGEESNLQQVDTQQMLYDKPANLFVAGLIGSPAMNFVRVELTAEVGAL
ncbi:hypothetical protein ACC713_38510, partial [Rhizobium johnstonii]